MVKLPRQKKEITSFERPNIVSYWIFKLDISLIVQWTWKTFSIIKDFLVINKPRSKYWPFVSLLDLILSECMGGHICTQVFIIDEYLHNITGLFEIATPIIEAFNISIKFNILNLAVFLSVNHFLWVIGHDFSFQILFLE